MNKIKRIASSEGYTKQGRTNNQQKTREPKLLMRLLGKKQELLISSKGVLIWRSVKVNQIVILSNPRDLVYKELHKRMVHLEGERVLTCKRKVLLKRIY